MLRAAAKNFRNVCVVVDPADYTLLLEQLDRRAGPTRPPGSTSRRRPSATPRATRRPSPAYFAQVEAKEAGIAVAPSEEDEFPYRLALSFEKVQDLRYGENPHQRAAFYSDLGSTLYSIAAARKLQGKELSFNNILDLDAAWRLVTELEPPACVIIKHTNPCGTGLGADRWPRPSRARWAVRSRLRLRRHRGLQPAPRRGGGARACRDVFVEAVIAPGYEPEAHEVLAAKKNLRVMDMDTTSIQRVTGFDLRRVMGGLLVQEWDLSVEDVAKCEVVSQRKPTARRVAGAAAGLDGRASTSSPTPSSTPTPCRRWAWARAR